MHAVRRYAPPVGLTLATIVGIIAFAILPLLTPITHLMLDHALSADRLGVSPSQAYDLSDTAIFQIVFSTEPVDVTGPDGQPFFSPADVSHFQDVSFLLHLVLGLGAVALTGLIMALRFAKQSTATIWRAVNRGADTVFWTVLVIGVIGVVAFRPAFRIFHQIFFPEGNYHFDPYTDHMVQLYPSSFWQVFTGVLGVIALALSYGVHRLASHRLTAGEPDSSSDDTIVATESA